MVHGGYQNSLLKMELATALALSGIQNFTFLLPSLAVQETPNLVDICWKVGGQGAGSNLISQREQDSVV